MDVKLENLIEKIKKEGVQEAKKESENIINHAKEEAVLLIEDAEKQADNIIKNAKQEVEKYKVNAEGAIRQAARDLVLVVKEKIKSMFDGALKRDVSDVLTSDFLKELILKITDDWSSDKRLEIMVSDEDKEKLQGLVFSNLKEDLKDSIIIKVDSKIDKGFRVAVQGEDVQYDFSDESIIASLKEFLNPALAEVLDKQ